MIGYFKQDFMVVFQFWLVGVAISVVVCESMRLQIMYSNSQFSYSIVLTFLFLSFAFQTGHSTIDILSNGLNLYQIEEGKNEGIFEKGSLLY